VSGQLSVASAETDRHLRGWRWFRPKTLFKRQKGGIVEPRTLLAYALIALLVATVVFFVRRERERRREERRRYFRRRS